MNWDRFRDPDLDPAWAGDDEEKYEPCPRCTYGEPTRHTCDPDQAAKHDLLIREDVDA